MKVTGICGEKPAQPVPSVTWSLPAMVLSALTYALLGSLCLWNGFAGALEDLKHGGNQGALGSFIDYERYKTACPDYKHYSEVPQYVRYRACEVVRRKLTCTPVDP